MDMYMSEEEPEAMGAYSTGGKADSVGDFGNSNW
jgi:hypothetical protein